MLKYLPYLCRGAQCAPAVFRPQSAELWAHTVRPYTGTANVFACGYNDIGIYRQLHPAANLVLDLFPRFYYYYCIEFYGFISNVVNLRRRAGGVAPYNRRITVGAASCRPPY